MCQSKAEGGRRCGGIGPHRVAASRADDERYLRRSYDLDAAAARGEDIGEKLAREKLTRDTALVDEIAERLGGR